jgi:hypothetical protein
VKSTRITEYSKIHVLYTDYQNVTRLKQSQYLSRTKKLKSTFLLSFYKTICFWCYICIVNKLKKSKMKKLVIVMAAVLISGAAFAEKKCCKKGAGAKACCKKEASASASATPATTATAGAPAKSCGAAKACCKKDHAASAAATPVPSKK